MFFKHQLHYVVIRAEAALQPITLAGAAQTLPAADLSKPIINVVMLRDVGSLRPPADDHRVRGVAGLRADV